MRKTLAGALCILISAPLFAAGYAAGSGDTVRNWAAKSKTEALAANKQFALYIYDAASKSNLIARDVESKDCLGSDAAIVGLEKFQRYKVRHDGTDSKGWPADWLRNADNGAAIYMCSADGKMFMVLEKTADKAQRQKFFGAAAAAIKSYEEKKKADFEKEKAARLKAAEAAAKAEKSEEVKPVAGLESKKKEEPKKKKEKGPEDE